MKQHLWFQSVSNCVHWCSDYVDRLFDRIIRVIFQKLSNILSKTVLVCFIFNLFVPKRAITYCAKIIFVVTNMYLSLYLHNSAGESFRASFVLFYTQNERIPRSRLQIEPCTDLFYFSLYDSHFKTKLIKICTLWYYVPSRL